MVNTWKNIHKNSTFWNQLKDYKKSFMKNKYHFYLYEKYNHHNIFYDKYHNIYEVEINGRSYHFKTIQSLKLYIKRFHG